MRHWNSILFALTLMVGAPAFAQAVPDAAPVAVTDAGATDAGVAVEAGDASFKAVDAAVPEAPKPVLPEAEVPESPEEVGTVISLLIDTAKAGHWQVFAGLLVLLLVYFFNRLGLATKIGKKWVPWVSLGIGTLVAVAAGLAEGTSLLNAVKLGLLEGGIAIALWELVVKHFTDTKSDGTPREA